MGATETIKGWLEEINSSPDWSTAHDADDAFIVGKKHGMVRGSADALERVLTLLSKEPNHGR